MAKKIHDREIIDMAMEELEGRPRWYYLLGQDHYDRLEDEENVLKPFDTHFTGVRTRYFFKAGVDPANDPNPISFKVFSNMKMKHKYRYDAITHEAICELLQNYSVASDGSKGMNLVDCYSECKVWNPCVEKSRIIYRASPYMDGRPWFDWGMFDLAEDDSDCVLGHIKCFLDLNKLPVPNADRLIPGMYAIVEYATPNTHPSEGTKKSTLFRPYIKTDTIAQEFAGGQHSQSRLVPLDRLVAPACVIPDLGNDNQRAYLRMLPRHTWADMFNDWLGETDTRMFEPLMQRKAAPIGGRRQETKKWGGRGRKKARKGG